MKATLDVDFMLPSCTDGAQAGRVAIGAGCHAFGRVRATNTADAEEHPEPVSRSLEPCRDVSFRHSSPLTVPENLHASILCHDQTIDALSFAGPIPASSTLHFQGCNVILAHQLCSADRAEDASSASTSSSHGSAMHVVDAPVSWPWQVCT